MLNNDFEPKPSPRTARCRGLAPLALTLFGALALGLFAGCIADTAEDSDLPWASNKNWEGMAPIAPAMLDRYD